jgi:transcriptional regulator with XRE-family HTH domain
LCKCIKEIGVARMQMGSQLAGPTVRRRRLGADLRRLREQNSLRLEEVASQLGVAPSTLSRIETGKAPTRTSYLVLMLDLYGVADPDRRRLLMDLAREGQRRGWWVGFDDLLAPGAGDYLGLEAEASVLRAFGVQAVPGLLRTPDYGSAVCAARRTDLPPEQVERLVAAQQRRQEVLGGTDPIELRIVLDESALLRSVAPSRVMRGQLEHLIEASAEPTITIQVLELAGPRRSVLAGPFAVLSFTEQDDADVACAEGIRGQVLLEQRAAEVAAMRATFDALSRSALSPRASAARIKDIAGHL